MQYQFDGRLFIPDYSVQKLKIEEMIDSQKYHRSTFRYTFGDKDEN